MSALNKTDGYLTLPIPQSAILNMIHQLITSRSMPDAHTICSHFNHRKISKLLFQSVPGGVRTLNQDDLTHLRRSMKKHKPCTACIESKPVKQNHKFPFVSPATTPLGRISTDLLYLGHKYLLVIIDH